MLIAVQRYFYFINCLKKDIKAYISGLKTLEVKSETDVFK